MNALLRICGLILLTTVLVTLPTQGFSLEASMDGPCTRPPVQFDHDAHNEAADLEESCNLCHHVFDDQGILIPDESSEEMTCIECHDGTQKGVPTTECAFHNRCKGCHATAQEGPMTCGQCHKK